MLSLGVDLVNFPKFARVDDSVTYPKADLDIRQRARRRLRRGAARLQRSVPGRPALHRLLDARRSPTKFLPWSEAYLQLCVDGWADRGGQPLRRGDHGRDRVGRVERPGGSRDRADAGASSSPRARLRGSRTQRCPRTERRDTRVDYTGLFTARPASPSSPSRSSSRGCSAATSTCCSASRPGPPRSPCATGSTRCSTSSGRCGVTPCCPALKKLKERVPRDHRQHRSRTG